MKGAFCTHVMVAVFICIAIEVHAAEKLVKIVGNGNSAQYIEDGQTKQLNVTIKVGDTIRWRNTGDKTHTVTCDLYDPTHKRIFDISLAINAEDKVIFDTPLVAAIAKAAGTEPDEVIHVGYFCAKHPTLMGGKIVISPASMKTEASDHTD